MVAKRRNLQMNLGDLGVRAGVGALNSGGKVLQSVGFEPPALERESLERAARRRTGLDDLGDWPIDEPFARLVESYRNEAHLSTLGRITVRELLVSLFEQLLHLEAERARAPAIANEVIEAPVFVVGLPRTGTTLLHGLLSADPASRAPLSWEVMYPAAYPNDARGIARARRQTAVRLGLADRLVPEFMKIHAMAADLPQECIAISAQAFASIQFHTTHKVPSYEDWFEREGQELAYAYHRRVLQHLQARGPAGRWVLKAPGHLFGLAALLEQYPDTRIIQTHRDPLRVLPSMASHATVLRRAFSDRVDPAEVAADWTARWARALENFLAIRDDPRAATVGSGREGSVTAPRCLDIGYDEIVAAPIATVERIYDFLGWTLSEEARGAMVGFLAANPRNKHGAHRYSLAQYGLDREAEIRRFRDYCERFEIAVRTDR